MIDDIICKKCLEEYNDNIKIPIKLNCGHSYCEKCLKEEITLKNNIKCDQDNIIYDGKIDILPKNIQLLNILINNKNEESNLIKEENLEEEKSETKEICIIHKKLLELICLKDYKMICPNCALFGEHKNHDLISIEQFYIELSNKASHIADIKCKIKIKNDYINSEKFENLFIEIIKNKELDFKNKIEKSIDTVIETLNNYKNNLFEELDLILGTFHNDLKNILSNNNKFNEKEEIINDKIEIILNKINKTENIDIEFLSKNLYNSDEIDKISNNLLKEMDNIEKVSLQNFNNKLDKWKLILNHKNLLKEIPTAIKINEERPIIIKEKNILNKSRNIIKKHKIENLLELNDEDDKSLSIINDDDMKVNKSFLRKSKKLNRTNTLLVNRIDDTKEEKSFLGNYNTNINKTNNSFINKSIINIKKKVDKNTINLSNKELFDKDLITQIPCIKSNYQIKKILLNNNKITDFGLKNLLMKLNTHSSLEYIDLSSNLLTDLSISFINDYGKKIKTLKIIKLENNKVKLKSKKYFSIFEDLKKSGLKITYK